MKKEKIKTDKVKLISYEVKMVIPVAQFSNIQPCITVQAPSIEEAEAYVAPHLNKLWKEYFMVNERRNEVAPTITVPTPPVSSGTSAVPTETVTMPTEAPPSSNVAVIKATQAIESCMSLEALDLIKNQIELSVKLAKEEKPALRAKVVERFNELNADAFIKKNA